SAALIRTLFPKLRDVETDARCPTNMSHPVMEGSGPSNRDMLMCPSSAIFASGKTFSLICKATAFDVMLPARLCMFRKVGERGGFDRTVSSSLATAGEVVVSVSYINWDKAVIISTTAASGK